MAEREITFTFKSGFRCTHNPTATDEEWWTFIGGIQTSMSMGDIGVVLTNAPYGIHAMADIEVVHFGDFEPPAGNPTLGFLKK